jgi:hypothetical protein
VAVGNRACASVEVLSDAVIKCSLPPGSGCGLSVSLTPVVPVVYRSGPGASSVELQLPSKKKGGFSYDGEGEG